MKFMTPVFTKSMALSRFYHDHTLNNQFYWHSILSRKIAFKSLAEINEASRVEDFFSEPNKHFYMTLGEWQRNTRDHENWLRLNILLASNSYFERYIYEIACLALANRPSLLLGDKKTINGVCFLKNQVHIELLYEKVKNELVKGAWSARRKQLDALFGIESFFPDETISILEEIRKLRNNIAHRFGRTICNSIDDFELENGIARISEKRLMGFLGLFSKTADQIDEHMLQNYVGNFELIRWWHFKSINDIKAVREQAPYKQFKHIIKQKMGKKYQYIRKENLEAILEHYDKCQ